MHVSHTMITLTSIAHNCTLLMRKTTNLRVYIRVSKIQFYNKDIDLY